MHAESLVRAENQPQQATAANNANESVTMMDLTRDGRSITRCPISSSHDAFSLHRFVFNHIPNY